MKFTIEVEDFWIEDGELSDELRRHIKNCVISDISKSIEEKVQKQITEKIVEAVNQKLVPIIDNKLMDLITTETVIYNRNEISIKNLIKDLFMRNTGWSHPKAQIEKIAKNFGEEMKAQYNAIFANNIVQGLKEQGLLKEEVVQMLLEKRK